MKTTKPIRLTPIALATLGLLSACGGGSPDYTSTATVGDTTVKCDTYVTSDTSARTNCSQISPGTPSPAIPGTVVNPNPPITVPNTSSTPPKESGISPVVRPQPQPQPQAVAPLQAPQTATPTHTPTAPAATQPAPLAVPANPVAVAPASTRNTVDRPDDNTLPQIHVIYVVPKGEIDRNLDTNGKLKAVTDAMQVWLKAQNQMQFRFDTAQGNVDITFATVPNTDEYYNQFGNRKHDHIQSDIEAQNLLALSVRKNYLVFYEGRNLMSCGDTNGNVAIIYLLTANETCALNNVSIHETLHTIGAQHVTDPADIMYSGVLGSQTNYRLGSYSINNTFFR